MSTMPVHFDPDVKAMEFEDNTNFTQGIRKQLMLAQMQGGVVPTDKDSVELMLKIAKGLDDTNIATQRVKVDTKNSDSAAQVADAMTHYVKLQENKNPFMRGADGGAVPTVGQDDNVRDAEFEVVTNIPRVDPARLGEHDFVDGEEEVGVIAETAQEFMARMAPVIEAKRALEDAEDK